MTARVPRDVLVFVAYQGLLVAVILVLTLTHGVGPSGLSFRFRKWDASWLLSIAHHGYQPDSERAPAIAFFPLYPATIRAAMFVIPKDVLAALVVTTASSIAGHVACYRALRSRVELADVAVPALVLLGAWPTAMWFSLVYTEGLYLALTAGFLACLLADRLGWAALLAGLAALTRQPGFLCVVPFTVWILSDAARPWRARIRRLGWVAVAASGYGVFLLINRIVYGRWFAFVEHLRTHWGKRTAPLTETIPAAVRFLRDQDWYFGWPNVADHILVLVALGVFVAWPVVERHRFDRVRWVLLAWGAAQVGLIASSSAAQPGAGWLSSTRYLMVVLPLLVAIVDLARHRRWVVYALAATGATFALLAADRWMAKGWVA